MFPSETSIRKLYKLAALSYNKGDTVEPSPRPMSNPQVFFCVMEYGFKEKSCTKLEHTQKKQKK